MTDIYNSFLNLIVYQIYPRSFNDANGDGITDIRDYVSMKECALTAKYDKAADINADGSVNASDLTELRKRLLEAE